MFMNCRTTKSLPPETTGSAAAGAFASTPPSGLRTPHSAFDAALRISLILSSPEFRFMNEIEHDVRTKTITNKNNRNEERNSMKIKTNIKSGGFTTNHNQGMIRARGLKIRTSVKSGGFTSNHNQDLRPSNGSRSNRVFVAMRGRQLSAFCLKEIGNLAV